MFAPMIDFPLESDFAPWLAPVADRCETRAWSARLVLPKIQDHGLTGGQELKRLRQGHQAIGLSEIFSETEERAVGRKVFQGFRFLMEQVNFHIHRIGF